jgi:hypothetical protein
MLGHLISFYNDPDPKIHFWNKDETESLDLIGQDVQLKFSDYVLCTGHKSEDTRHKCSNRYKGKKQCAICRAKDISNIYTRLDFTQYPHLEDEYKKQEFSVYLAAFGTNIVKCGVTRTERVSKRLYEQGADYWCEIMRFDNGESAYNCEVELQNRFNLKNFVRNDTKVKLLNSTPSEDALRAKLDLICSCNDLSDNLHSTKIQKNNFQIPEKFSIAESLNGQITGSKANILFFKKDNSFFAYPMHKNIGRIFIFKE